ncbi:sporulation-delaying protein SdpB family protein [Microbispora sp. CA-135349]|uniref:sporulation-delaying protein SdpB family protein n=1 Tax=Microbispora sp. CA-135349 TaxID=3239953 RepID=UPI003D8EF65D
MLTFARIGAPPLARIGAAARLRAELPPWTNVYGLARTLLALATAGTLTASPVDALFDPYGPACQGVSSLGLFCLVPEEQLGLTRGAAVAVLVVVASGWRPRLTALPHWWLTFGFQVSTVVPDGGDQIASVVTLLLLPVALNDRRRWHWHASAPSGEAPGPVASLVAWSAVLVIRLQVAGLYFQASVSKLGREEWADGTALYYWLSDPMFGAPSWMSGILGPVLRDPLGVTVLTWGPLVVEFAVAMGLIVRRRAWPYLLASGVVLHCCIAALMGLTSFAVTMIACLILHLRPVELPFAAPYRPAAWRPRGSWGAMGPKAAGVS